MHGVHFGEVLAYSALSLSWCIECRIGLTRLVRLKYIIVNCAIDIAMAISIMPVHYRRHS